MMRATALLDERILAGALLVGGTLACGGGDGTGPSPSAGLPSCTATAQTGGTLDVPVGGVRVLGTPTDVACVRLALSDTGAEYLVVVSNASQTLDAVQHFALEVRAQGPTTAAALETMAARAAVAPRAPRASLGRELAIRDYERRHLRVPGAFAAARAEHAAAVRAAAGASDRRAPATRAASVAAPVPAVGETMQFRVPGESDPCTSYDSVTAQVKFVGERAILVQDVASPARGFTDADFASISAEFDRLIFPTDSAYFGTPSDIDANGHVYVLFTPEINKLTKRGDASFFAGFFFAGDLFPRSGASGQSCAESNVAEVFYLLVPDPDGQFSDPRSAADVRQLTRGTVAHEFQHMINAGGRLRSDAAGFEQTWLDEGLAHFAEEAVGRAERGFGDLQELSFSDVAASRPEYDAFFAQNLLRFATWLERPDTSAGPSAHTGDDLSGRGQSWALVRYSSEKYSGGDARAFTRKLAAGPDTGLTNLTKRAGVPYDSILAGFMVANFADDRGVPDLDARYEYGTWDMRGAVRGAAGGDPPRVNPLATGAPPSTGCVSSAGASSYVCESRSGAAAYFRVSSDAALAGLAVRLVDASDTTRAVFPEARLFVMRSR
ncbi:MAG: hypothetical protein ACJ79S_07895 [Gemmatimonadaceae bacterium]